MKREERVVGSAKKRLGRETAREGKKERRGERRDEEAEKERATGTEEL